MRFKKVPPHKLSKLKKISLMMKTRKRQKQLVKLSKNRLRLKSQLNLLDTISNTPWLIKTSLTAWYSQHRKN